MLGRVDNNCEIDTIAGPVPGLVQKPEYCLDHNYEVVLTNGGCGTGFVGVSGECQITFNPHCCVGLDEDLCPIYKGVLTVDKVVACDYEGVDANKINACPTTDNIDINVALVGPEDLDNMNSILYGCGHAISYNPGTGVMKVSEIDAETCDLSLGGGTAIVCYDCRLHTCLAGTISCDTVYEPSACCTGVSSGETLNATALNCDGKLVKMSCVGYEASPSGYDLPLCSKVIPGTSLTTNTAIKTPFIYNDELSISANCNITLGICPTCDTQCNWVTGAYVGLTGSGYHCLDLYSDHTTTLKAGRQLRIQAGSGNKYCPVCGGGFSTIEMATYCLKECTCQIVECTGTLSSYASVYHHIESPQVSVCVTCCALANVTSACIKMGCGHYRYNNIYSVSSGGPIIVTSSCPTCFRVPELHICNGTFAIGNGALQCCATITPTGYGTFNGLCVYGNCDVNISDVNINVYCQGELTAKITRTGTICGNSLLLNIGYEGNDWSLTDYVPNAHQIHKHIKTNGINDVVVICSLDCTYDSPLVDGHVYYLCFDSPMISADGSSPMAITYNWGTNCSKTYNLTYVNEQGMGATYTGFDKCSGTKYYVDALAGFFVTPDGNSLRVTGQAMAGRDSTGTCEYWIGRGWRSAVSQVQQSFDKARPIGSTYTQFPDTDDPNTLFNDGDITSTWTELNFVGAFFRASGGTSCGFNCGLQPESIAPHCHCVCNLNLNHYHNITVEFGADANPAYSPQHGTYLQVAGMRASSRSPYAGAICGALDNVNFSTLNTIYPHQPAPETRPANYTIRIWKRTA